MQVQVPIHLFKLDPRADLRGEGEIVPEPLQVDAEGVRQLRHLRMQVQVQVVQVQVVQVQVLLHLAVLEAVPELIALLAAVHVVALQLIRREEAGEAVQERDVGAIEPAEGRGEGAGCNFHREVAGCRCREQVQGAGTGSR